METRAIVPLGEARPPPRVQRPARLPPPKRALPPAPVWTDSEKRLARALLCHPQLVPRVGVLTDALDNRELRGWIKRLTEALVRHHQEDPHQLVLRVPIAKDGVVVTLSSGVHQAGGFSHPGSYFTEESSAQIIEDAVAVIDRRLLEKRLGEVQPTIAEAGARGDHSELKRLLTEQTGLVRQLQGRAPVPTPLAALIPAMMAGEALKTRPASSETLNRDVLDPDILQPDILDPDPVAQPADAAAEMYTLDPEDDLWS